MGTKIRIGVIFGGRSAEHEISLQSAKNVVEALDPNKYEVTLIGIDKEGAWHVQEVPQLPFTHPELPLISNSHNLVTLTTDKNQSLLVDLLNKQKPIALDVIFPVLHGPYGEDGTIQGLLKLANVPFVGADVLGSAVCMDKDVMKRLLKEAQLPTSKFVTVTRSQLHAVDLDNIIQQLGLPCFVKPANLGSSIGISKVKEKSQLLPAIEAALAFDQKVVIETFIDGREIECAVLGNDQPIASIPGEIIPHHEFYSYEAKYLDDNGASLEIPAKLAPMVAEQVRELAIKAYQTLCCEGLARVDFFLTKDNTLFINELNTLPGFTKISMYPKLWQESGIGYSELIDKLINLALDKFDRHQSLKTKR